MAINDELLKDTVYRNDKINTLKAESDAFTKLFNENKGLTEHEIKAYRSVTSEWARITTSNWVTIPQNNEENGN